MSINTVANHSVLSALRELQLHDFSGIVISDGYEYRYAPTSHARSKKMRQKAKEALAQIRKDLSKPTVETLKIALLTILKGDSEIEKVSGDNRETGKVILERYEKVIESSLNKVEENLSVIEEYSKNIGGRSGAIEFIRRLKEINPGDFFFTQDDIDEISRIAPEVVNDYLKENDTRLKGDKKNFTLEDTRIINQRIQNKLGTKDYRMIQDSKAGAQYIETEIQSGRKLDAGLEYEGKMVSKLYPTLEQLIKDGHITKDKPIYLVELGNNCIQNNMQTYLLWKLITRFLKDHRLENQGLFKEVQLTSFGGHPQTATFDAHIEVEESKLIVERCKNLIKNHEKWIFNALEDSVAKLGFDGQLKAKEILKDSQMSPSEKLDALLQSDVTRPLFRMTVGTFSRILHPEYNPKDKDGMYAALSKSLYFFKGVGESTTHTALMLACGNKDIPIQTEDVSTNTGENIQLLKLEGEPVVIPVDFCPVGRQVVTYTHQGQKGSAVFSSLIDLPMSYYRKRLTDEQLLVETASYFAELARNILYRTVDNYVSAFPMDDKNYDLLWDYYSALKGYSNQEATKNKDITPIKTIFETVKNGFVQFEKTIPHGPVMDKSDPNWISQMKQRLSKYYQEMVLRSKLLDQQ